MTNLETKVNLIAQILTCSDEPTISKLKENLTELMAAPEEAAPAVDLPYIVDQCLKELAVPYHISGHEYLHTAICLMAQDESYRHRFVDRLYPDVAKMCVEYTTSTRVERCMRHAVQRAWDRVDLDVAERYFGNCTSPSRGNPTNSEFVCVVAREARRRLQALGGIL